MASRRQFITRMGLASAAVAAGPLAALGDIGGRNTSSLTAWTDTDRGTFPQNFGIGGVALGNGFHENSNDRISGTLQAAWEAGVRYFDTSPFYGHGLSERRLGHFLFEKKRDEFQISTKIGRVLYPDPGYKPGSSGIWKGRLNFSYRYDYSAAGTRRSIEESLQRLGLSSIDMVLVHDLSPDTEDMGGKWTEYFEQAEKGAFPELTRMREEGIIKGWGLGVNTPEPIMRVLDAADPDIMLVAIQYTIMEHKNALDNVFPKMAAKKVKAIIGGPLNAGFSAGLDRWNYKGELPAEMLEKRAKMNAILKKYNVELRTAALQFSAAHPVVGAVIPGASTAEQVRANVKSMSEKIPAAVWEELKSAGLIEKQAPVPK